MASIDSRNMPEIRTSGMIDTSDPISTDKLIDAIKTGLESKEFEDVSVHISQLNFLMDIPE